MVVGGRAERHDQMVIGQAITVSFRGCGVNDLALDVDIFDRRLDEACASKDGTDRLGTVPQFQPSGAGFEQEWREDEEVLATHERDLDVRMPADATLEMTRRGHTAESAAQYDDTQAASLT